MIRVGEEPFPTEMGLEQKRPTAGATRLGDVPREARHYLDTLEEFSGVPVTLVSTGPDREAFVRRRQMPILRG